METTESGEMIWTGDRFPQRVIAIEYGDDGWPHSAKTEERWDHTREPWFRPGSDKPTGTSADQWDFNYSRAHGELFRYNSGSGGDPLAYDFGGRPVGWVCRVWIAPDVKTFEYRKRGGEWTRVPASRSKIESRGYRLLKRPRLLLKPGGGTTRNPFEVSPSFSDYPCVWCSECKDWYPDGLDYSDPCEHITWCDDCSCYVLLKDRSYVDDERQKCECLITEGVRDGD